MITSLFTKGKFLAWPIKLHVYMIFITVDVQILHALIQFRFVKNLKLTFS